jgi:membrane-bound ClpP family serine protease
MCHLIFLAPVLALPVFWLLPLSLALPIYLGVVGMTGLVLWPIVGSMRQPLRNGVEGMIGARGEAVTDLNPTGLVRCQGEVWAATAEEPVGRGQRVWVLDVDSLRLTVGRHAPPSAARCPGHAALPAAPAGGVSGRR